MKQCLVYTGARNGSIKRFDTRTRAPGLALLGDAKTKSCDSVIYLNIIKDWQLLVSTIRGAVRCFFILGLWRLRVKAWGKKKLLTFCAWCNQIEIFDVRFLRDMRPLLTLAGHVNAYQPSLVRCAPPYNFFGSGPLVLTDTRFL